MPCVVGRRGGGHVTRRQVWLEREMKRLNTELVHLVEENGKLMEELTAAGVPREHLNKDLGAGASEDSEDGVALEDIKLEDDPASDGMKAVTTGDGVNEMMQTNTGPCNIRLAAGAESMEEMQAEIPHGESRADVRLGGVLHLVSGKMNTVVAKGSALSLGRGMQAFVYLIALAGVIFVLVATSMELGKTGGDPAAHMIGEGMNALPGLDEHAHDGDAHGGEHADGDGHAGGEHAGEEHAGDEHAGEALAGEAHGADSHGGDAHASDPPAAEAVTTALPTTWPRFAETAIDTSPGRLLEGAAAAAEEPNPALLMKNIAVSLTGCGLIALTVNVLKQPLILGYLLGGVLVGPIGLGIVESHVQINELSSLGLIFLLFMIGLELDIMALLKMGKVVLVTGGFQFPICAGIMVAIFMGLEAIGLNFGTGPYASMYCGMVCGISSTMIVVKVLGEKGETDSQAGRLTVGILIFQDIWAIIVLAIQPNLASPEIGGILKTFGMIGVLVVIALLYAKFVMPAVLYHTSSNLELMLVMSLSWCFFICITAILPFVGLSMELASLIAGVALATFPYSAEFNGKIKYIRDFFITLFFAGLGMQIPVPTPAAVLMGLLVGIVVLIFRWLGIFCLVYCMGGGARLGAVSTINLSQISEFALVICSLGMSFGHINDDTMVIIIWTFAILAISASYMIGYNTLIYTKLATLAYKLRGKTMAEAEEHGHDHGEERDIVLLGYHKVAFMLMAEIKAKSPQLLKRIHIIDFDQSRMSKLREMGLQCTYGDISSPDVLEHAHHGEPRLCISSIPDSMLRGVTNAQLVKVAKKVWKECHFIAAADSPEQARILYNAGADYVLRMAKLCAERLHELLAENCRQAIGGGELQEIFDRFKDKDKELKPANTFVGQGF